MTRFAATFIGVLLSGSLILTGCFPSAPEGDEQKDPHYLNGRARVSSLDYKGAMEEFEKAIEKNPRSSSAHLELALLYEDQLHDFAAALYHYEKHLKLRPQSEYAERAKERIQRCRMELAKTEMLAPVTLGMQREYQRVVAENAVLTQKIQLLESQLMQQQQAAAANVVRNMPTTTPVPAQSRAAVSPQSPAPAYVSEAATNRVPAPTASQGRVHIVKTGDKLTTIASQYGVSLSRLQQANPNVDPRRLKIGQSIRIP